MFFLIFPPYFVFFSCSPVGFKRNRSLLEICFCDFSTYFLFFNVPLLVLKGIDHYWHFFGVRHLRVSLFGALFQEVAKKKDLESP